jgi:hypothetical protein
LIDPVTIGVAYKAATSAIDLIKKGINMHKDATEIGDHLLQYFEKRDEAQRLKKELQKQNKRKKLLKKPLMSTTFVKKSES